MKTTPTSTQFRLLTASILASLTLGSALAAEDWTEDFAAAKDLAAKNKKDLLIDFTGSDWCPYCIKLKKEVLSKPEFIAAAPKSFVLVELDFPQQKEQSAKIKTQNEKLQQEYGIEGFPTILLTDAEGRAYAKTGYVPGGAAPYVEHLTELHSVREKRDAAFAKAAAATGLDKAKALDEGVKAIDEEIAQKFYAKEIEEIIKLDPEDTLGRKKGMEMTKASEELTATLETLAQGQKTDEFTAAIDGFITKWKLEGGEKQRILMNKFGIYDQRKLDEAEKLADELIAIDANTPYGKQAASIKEQIAKMRIKGEDKETEDKEDSKEEAPKKEAK